MVDGRTQDRTTTDFIGRLRAATGPMHQRLENTPLSRALMQDNLTLATYINYLVHMREVVAWSEQHIFPMIGEVLPDVDKRRKLALIDDDIAVLRAMGEVARPLAFEGFGKTATKSEAHALGHMYVMEGSTLGGRMILQHVKKVLALDENTAGVSFFAGYGAETGARWKIFMAAMAERATNAAIADDIISGATDAFEQIEHYFSGNTVCR